MVGDSHSGGYRWIEKRVGTDLINGSWNDGALEPLAADADADAELPEP
jgi:hypothetical protein